MFYSSSKLKDDTTWLWYQLKELWYSCTAEFQNFSQNLKNKISFYSNRDLVPNFPIKTFKELEDYLGPQDSIGFLPWVVSTRKLVKRQASTCFSLVETGTGLLDHYRNSWKRCNTLKNRNALLEFHTSLPFSVFTLDDHGMVYIILPCLLHAIYSINQASMLFVK